MLFGAKVFLPLRQRKGMSLEWRPRESETRRFTEGQRAAVELGFQGENLREADRLAAEHDFSEAERRIVKRSRPRSSVGELHEAAVTAAKEMGDWDDLEGIKKGEQEINLLRKTLTNIASNSNIVTKSEEEHLQHIIDTMQEVLRVINELQDEKDSAKVHAQLAKESGELKDLLDEHKQSLRLIRSLENVVRSTLDAFRRRYGNQIIQRSRILEILYQELLQLLKDSQSFDKRIEELEQDIMRLGQALTVYSTRHQENSAEVSSLFDSVTSMIGKIINSTQECKQMLETIKQELSVMRRQTDSL